MVQPVLPHPVCVVMGLSLLPAQAVFSSSGGGFGKGPVAETCGGARTDVQAGVRLGGPDVLKGDPGSWLLKSWHLSLGAGSMVSAQSRPWDEAA